MVRKLGWQHLVGSRLDMKTVIEKWQPGVIKVVATGSIDKGYLLQLAPFAPPETKLVYRIWKHGSFHSDHLEEWLPRFASPEVAAQAWVEEVASELQPLEGLARRRWVGTETFNEQGIDEPYCVFSREVARLVYERWGLHHVALNPSVGSTNKFEEWRGVANSGLLEELKRTGGMVGVHGYWSWFVLAWNHPGWQKSDIELIAKNRNPDTLYQAMEIPPIPYADLWMPYWTAFAVHNFYYYLKEHYRLMNRPFPDVKFMLTEWGIDDVQDPGIGFAGRGWLTYADAGTYTGWLRPGDDPASFYAKQLLYSEKWLNAWDFVDSAAIFAFDETDAPDAPWRNFRLDKLVVPHLLRLMESEPMPTPPPTPDTTCYVTATGNVNVRKEPLIAESTYFEPRRFIRAGEKYKALAKVKGPNDSNWYKIDHGGVEAFVSSGVTQLVGNCSILDKPPDPEPTPDNIEALKQQIIQLNQALEAERTKTASLEKELTAVKAERDALKNESMKDENSANNAAAKLNNAVELMRAALEDMRQIAENLPNFT